MHTAHYLLYILSLRSQSFYIQGDSITMKYSAYRVWRENPYTPITYFVA